MLILIGGDYAPTSFTEKDFWLGNAEKLYSAALLQYLASFDFRIFDFECCFDGAGSPIRKYGPILTAPVACMEGILPVQPSLMVLANNHSANLGSEGLEHTIAVFAEHGIPCVGAGTPQQAAQPHFLEKDGIRVGIYACAEHEFTYATEAREGVNGYDPLRTFDEIRNIKEECDALIVFYHGGILDWRYPAPAEQKALRKMVDCGADLVVGQHTHCIGCQEVYRGKTILYGQGDFLFARPTRNDLRYSGLLLEAEVTERGVEVSYRVRVKPRDTIRLADPAEEKVILREFASRSEELQEEGALAGRFREYVSRRATQNIDTLSGRNVLYRAYNKATRHKAMEKWFLGNYGRGGLLRLINFLECETHRETLLEYLKQLAGIPDDQPF